MSMPSIDTVLSQLKAGNERYVNDQVTAEGRDSTRRAELTTGQAPWAIVLSCADSRVAPEVLFDTGLGELFVVRVAGNVANPSTIASIEYAVSQLGTKLVVVLGHEECGAVGATLQQLRLPVPNISPHLESIIEHVRPAFRGLTGPDAEDEDEGLLERAIRANVATQTDKLREASTILRKLEQDDGLLIVGALYSLRTGGVEFLGGA